MSILKDYRARAELSQAKMAEAMGLPLRTYEDIESGRSQIRPIHVHAAQMALIHQAIARSDASIIPHAMWGGLKALGALLEAWEKEGKQKPA